MKKFPLNQSLRLITSHVVSSLVIFLAGLLLFAGIITHSVGSIIFSTITTIIYFFGIYSAACEMAVRDKKKYTPEEPYMLKGLVLGAGIFVVSLFLYALYFAAWRLMTVNGMLFSAAGWINNFLFIIWSFPFSGFLKLSNGMMAWYGYIIVAVVPFIASFLGYYAGYVGFDLYGKFINIMYEKKNKENEK